MNRESIWVNHRTKFHNAASRDNEPKLIVPGGKHQSYLYQWLKPDGVPHTFIDNGSIS